MLSVDEAYNTTYTIRKLEKRGLVKSARAGKGKLVGMTPAGKLACEACRETRERLLVARVRQLSMVEVELSRLSTLPRGLSATYDQAARAAAA
jgi:predicted MarR family transcription regulator